MTVLEFLKTASKEEIAKYFCLVVNEDCDNCIAKDSCYKNHTGFIDLLNKELEDSVEINRTVEDYVKGR